MKLSADARQALIDHETPRGKYSPFPYKDAKGVWTIGIGFTEGVTSMTPPMPYDEALVKFDEMLATEYEPQIDALIGDAPTSQKQYDALGIFAWNVGIPQFKTSTVLRLHKAGKYQGAAAAFSFWNKVTSNGVDKINGQLYAKGQLVVLNGLTARRADEARLYLDGSTADGEGNPNDAIERSTQPSGDADKPLGQTRTVAGGTLAATAATMSIVAQVSTSAKDVASNTVGIFGEFGDSLLPVLGVGGGIAAIAGVSWMLYSRWDDRQKGLR